MPLSPFEGKIGKTYKESESAWLHPPQAPEGAPNVIVILLDDVGFGQTSTFGGQIPTQSLDKLASEGLRFNRFHTTAICGPSRAALLTGRNHHDFGNGFLMEWATGFPEYSTMLPRDTATIGEILKDNGYATWWFGKNHNTPDWETTVAGPFDRWPTGMGFEYFCGFNAGETHQYYPVLFENTTPVEPDKSPEQGYHFMTDITDRAIARMRFSKSVAPGKPLLHVLRPRRHARPPPRHRRMARQVQGQVRHGLGQVPGDGLQAPARDGHHPAGHQAHRPPGLGAGLGQPECRAEEGVHGLDGKHAGFFAYTDHEVGRLLDAVKELPDADNTMVIYIVGDNGASSEGGPDGTLNEIRALNGLPTEFDDIVAHLDILGGPESEPHYPVGWAWAGNTPFQWVKQVASHLGGTRNPMVISWPARIKHDDKPRDAFPHLVDVVPTILEAAHIPMPETINGIEQQPLAGESFLASFDDPSFKGRNEQYFEVFSNRSIYEDGWKADAQHTFPWRQDYAPGNWDKDRWELYNLNVDFSEANDLAPQMPEKLAEMKQKFDEAALKYHVYPLDDRGAGRLAIPKPPVPGFDPDCGTYTYFAGATRIPEAAAPPMKNRSWTLTANLRTDGDKTQGVVMAFGGVAAGIVLYVKDGVPVFDYTYFEDHTVLKGDKPLPAGESVVELDFDYLGGEEPGKGADLVLKVNGEQIASGHMDATVGGRFGIDTFGIGEDTGQPVSFEYQPPFAFNGGIDGVEVVVK